MDSSGSRAFGSRCRQRTDQGRSPSACGERHVGLLLLLQQRRPQQPRQHEPEGHAQREHGQDVGGWRAGAAERQPVQPEGEDVDEQEPDEEGRDGRGEARRDEQQPVGQAAAADHPERQRDGDEHLDAEGQRGQQQRRGQRAQQHGRHRLGLREAVAQVALGHAQPRRRRSAPAAGRRSRRPRGCAASVSAEAPGPASWRAGSPGMISTSRKPAVATIQTVTRAASSRRPTYQAISAPRSACAATRRRGWRPRPGAPGRGPGRG